MSIEEELQNVAPAKLAVEKVSKRFPTGRGGEVHALDDVSFHVNVGGFVTNAWRILSIQCPELSVRKMGECLSARWLIFSVNGCRKIGSMRFSKQPCEPRNGNTFF